MAFYDIDRVWEYNDLIKIAERNKPYRGSTEMRPKYPLGNRRYSDRYFVPRIDLIPEDQKAIMELHKPHYGYDKWYHHSPPIDIHYSDRYKLGTFHPDDTFEFSPGFGSYGQGDTDLMASLLPGWVQFKSQYGGCVFTHKQTRKVVPVYEGLRIRLADGEPTEPIELYVNSLDKKATKPYRDKYESIFKLALPMLKTMGIENIIKELQEMGAGKVAPMVNYRSANVEEVFVPNDPTGTVLWLALRYDYKNAVSLQHGSSWSLRAFMHVDPVQMVKTIKASFMSEVYHAVIQRGENILHTKLHPIGDKLPTAEWGQRIVVGGVERKRLI